MVMTEDYTDKTEVDPDTNKTIGGNLRGNMRRLTDRVAKERMGTITEMTGMIEAGKGLQKGHFSEAITTIEIGVQATVDPGQDPGQVQTEIG